MVKKPQTTDLIFIATKIAGIVITAPQLRYLANPPIGAI